MVLALPAGKSERKQRKHAGHGGVPSNSASVKYAMRIFNPCQPPEFYHLATRRR